MPNLYDELDDTIRVAESNLSLIKTMAATILEYGEQQNNTMGRINGFVREASAVPILPVQEAPQVQQQAPQPPPQYQAGQPQAQPRERSWGEVLSGINEGIPRATVKKAG